MSHPPITGISSMATRALLADLVAAYEPIAGVPVVIESVGGVDAAKRVLGGEVFDVVVLASDAINKLIDAGRIIAGSEADLVHSGVAVAVKAGAVHPDISSEEAAKRAVLAAPTLGYSTGPSGLQLVKLFERWGIAREIAPRIVKAPPGVPVGTLVARGQVALGFQQLSELMHLDGIDVIGPLPPEIQIVTTFSAGVCAAAAQPDAARALVAFLTSPDAADAKRRHGMEPT
jgi:molybdate transport system substrate-binding protein